MHDAHTMMNFIVFILSIFGGISIGLLLIGTWKLFKHFIDRNTK